MKLLLLILLLMSPAYASTWIASDFYGQGDFETRTHLPTISDYARGHGDWSYGINASVRNASEGIFSGFAFRGYGGAYRITERTPGQIQHTLQLTGLSNVSAKSTIRTSENDTATLFLIKGSGSAKEYVIGSDLRGRPVNLRETRALNSVFEINSSVRYSI